jgi:mRNA interferase RelE/StbE
MSSAYLLTLSRNSIKYISKQDRNTQERIRKALIGLTIRPPIGDIKPVVMFIKNRSLYRTEFPVI